jgi:hypothetical protein
MQFGNATAESGVAGGSDFALSRFDNTGAYIDSPLVILRGNGILVAADGISAPQAIGDNRIINGDMRIDQRNNGATGTASGYTVDRWQYQAAQASKGVWQRNTGGPSGFPYSLYLSSSSAYASVASDYFQFSQAIEADMVSDFAWGTSNAQPVTLSFWALSSLTGSFSGSIRNAANNRSYPFSFSIPTASTWTRVVVTVPGDTGGTWVMSGNAGALVLAFDLGCGTTYRGPANAWAAANYIGVTGSVSIVATNGASLFLTGVKLEIGSVATPYNRQSLAKSMADCQRYFQQPAVSLGTNYAVGFADSTTNFLSTMPLVVTMRAAPTVAFSAVGTFGIRLSGGTQVACTAVTLAAVTASAIQINGSVASGLTTGQGILFRDNNVTTSTISLSAEL